MGIVVPSSSGYHQANLGLAGIQPVGKFLFPRPERLRASDYVFTVGLILATMTSLRVETLPVGPGELTLMLWLVWRASEELIQLDSRVDSGARRSMRQVALAGLFLLIVLLSGAMVSAFLGRITNSDLYHDLTAYVFTFLIAVLLFDGREAFGLQSKATLVTFLGSACFFLLYLDFSYGSQSFTGIQLGDLRFTGGAANPNQLALFLAPLPFIAASNFWRLRRHWAYACVWLFTSVCGIVVGASTQSDALLAAWYFAGAIMALAIAARLLGRHLSALVLLSTTVAIVLVLMIWPAAQERLVYRLDVWFTSVDEGEARSTLWNGAIVKGLESPIVGFGPGPQIEYVPGFRSEAHNIYLDIFTQAGILGLVALVCLTFVSIYSNRRDPAILAGSVALFVFCLGHFALRQPIFWFWVAYFIFSHYRRPLPGLQLEIADSKANTGGQRSPRRDHYMR